MDECRGREAPCLAALGAVHADPTLSPVGAGSVSRLSAGVRWSILTPTRFALLQALPASENEGAQAEEALAKAEDARTSPLLAVSLLAVSLLDARPNSLLAGESEERVGSDPEALSKNGKELEENPCTSTAEGSVNGVDRRRVDKPK